MQLRKSWLLTLGLMLQLFMSPTLALSDEYFENDSFEKIIIDYTLTVWGHEFYQNFTSYMRNDLKAVSFDSLKVEELFFQTGSKIKIIYNSKTILETTIFPGGRDLEGRAKNAASLVKQRIYNQNMEKKFFRDPDLGMEDF